MPIYRIIPTLATTYLRDLNRTMCQCSFGHLGSSKLTAINRNKVMCDFRILTLSFYNFTCESSYVSLERAVCMFISTHTPHRICQRTCSFSNVCRIITINVLSMSTCSFLGSPNPQIPILKPTLSRGQPLLFRFIARESRRRLTSVVSPANPAECH